MLIDPLIRELASSDDVYKRGVRYFKQDRVTEIEFDKQSRAFYGTVEGNDFYQVMIHFNRNLLVDNYECDCPAFYQYKGACKHVVALMKAVQTQWYTYFPAHNIIPFSRMKSPADVQTGLKTDAITLSLMNLFEQELSFSYAPKAEFESKTKLIPTYHFDLAGGRRQHSLNFQIGSDRTYVMRDIPAFLDACYYHQDLVYGKNYVFQPDKASWEDTSVPLLQLMMQAYNDEKSLSGSQSVYFGSAVFAEKKHMHLSNSMLVKFFEIMGDRTFDMFLGQKKIAGLRIVEERPPFRLNLKIQNGGLSLSPDMKDKQYLLDWENRYIYYNEQIYHADKLFAETVAPIINAFDRSPDRELKIADDDVSRFFTTVLPVLEKVAEVQRDPAFTEKYYYEEPEKRIYFDRFRDGITARIEFRYHDQVINPALRKPAENAEDTAGKILLRATRDEKQLIEIFKRYMFQLYKGSFVLEEENLLYSFLQEALPELEELAGLYYSEDFNKVSINRAARVSPGVKLVSSGLLELSLDYENISPQEFADILKSYKLKKKYYRMKNGSFLPLDNSEIKSVAELVEDLDISSNDIARGDIQLPGYRALYIDQINREKGLQIQRSSAFKTLVRELREPQESDYALPSALQAHLRHYQENGFKWLKTLSAYGLGGILADDMGLGKTIQILSLLLSEKSEDSLPSLVIAPTSLVYHWQDEARRFAPSLQVIVISGTQSERMEILKSLDSCDMAVTSYGLIKRDFEYYRDHSFQYCILDEAQNIKNPNTLVAKTVKQLQASRRFALTGTPMENSLTELWSIFDYLMPGYLLNHNKFKSRYELPIIKNQQPEAMQDLKRHIQPFVLRRLKKEVLQELPPKTENKMSSPMTAEQHKLYLAYLLQAQKDFQDEIQKNGFDRSQIKILSILTRLRQICCHPSLFIENYGGGSGKLELLLEILNSAIDSGHRILVFSQFTGMLGLIKTQLEHASIPYYYLDGATPAEKRIKLVHFFNEGRQKVFLISLKAGGTGLNLTGADVVIHYDPWWNPAVEDQATDRAYRIGQKNAVQVIKLISKDSIEEKIYELQQKKKALIDTVIQPGESFLNKMNQEDIRSLFEI